MVCLADGYLIQIYVKFPDEIPTSTPKKDIQLLTSPQAAGLISAAAAPVPKEPFVGCESRKRKAHPQIPSPTKLIPSAVSTSILPPPFEASILPPPAAQISPTATHTNTATKPTTSQLTPTLTNLPALKVVNHQRIADSINQISTSNDKIPPTTNTANFHATPYIPNTTAKQPANVKAIETITGSDGKSIPVVNLSKMGLSLAQLSKSVTFVTTKGGDLVAQLPYDQLCNFFKLSQNTPPPPTSLNSKTNVALTFPANSLVPNSPSTLIKNENNNNHPPHSKSTQNVIIKVGCDF